MILLQSGITRRFKATGACLREAPATEIFTPEHIGEFLPYLEVRVNSFHSVLGEFGGLGGALLQVICRSA